MLVNDDSHPYKVAFLITGLNRGGTELRLMDVLELLDRSSFDPFLFVGKGGGELLNEIRDQRVIVGSSPKSNIIRSLPALWKSLKSEKPDVIWCLQSNILSLAGRVFAKILHTSVVVISLHGTAQVGQPTMDFLNRFVTRWTTNKIVVLSQQYRARAIAEGLPENLIIVQYNGVDTECFSPPTDKQIEKTRVFGIDPLRPVIGIVGNLHPLKAQEVFIRAAKQVTLKYPNALFVIVGEGSRRKGLEQLTYQLGLGDSVRFLGRRADVSNVLRAFDIFVLTSNSEGCSNATLEALATGLPVVTTDFGGASELVIDEVGFLVPRGNDKELGDRIIQLLDSPDLRQTMGEAARKRAEESFSLDKMIRDREKLLLKLLESGS